MANRRLAAALTAALLAALLAAPGAACRSGGTTTMAHRVRVAAQPFALAEVARRVGLDRVVVSDRGDVVLDSGADPDPWLDPVAMEAVTDRVAAALWAADPAGRSAYQAGARAYRAQLAALDIDYRRSLADCARHDVVTADGAFGRMAARYNFLAHQVNEPGIGKLIESRGIPVVFTEAEVAPGPTQALARSAHVGTVMLDTLIARTPEEAARHATYVALMTDNLARLRTALACASS